VKAMDRDEACAAVVFQLACDPHLRPNASSLSNKLMLGAECWPEGKKVITTLRAPYKTRSWSETEVAALRSMVKTGKDAHTIGKELHRSFLAIQAKAKKLNRGRDRAGTSLS
jgi:hypothetical protein